MKIPASPLVIALAAGAVLFLAACGGDDNSSTFRPGRLTDPRDVATATPWVEAPEVIPIDPNAIAPITGEATPPPDGGPAASPSANGEPGVCGSTYTIKAGDTLFDIASKCEVSLDDLRAANPGLDPATLRIGQTIKMPPKED